MASQQIQPPYWWEVYGPFTSGVSNMPHAGQVIRWYRKKRGWEVDDLAHKLDLSMRRIYELEETAAMPVSISRREALVQLLGIPFELLNLPRSMEALASPLTESTFHLLHPHTLNAYESALTLAWETYYTGNVQLLASMVDYWLVHLKDSMQALHGSSQNQLQALYCRFLQLSGAIARDRLDFRRAFHDSNTATALAFQLENPELIASALYRRARISVEQQQYDVAIQDLEGALPYASRSRDPLRCYVSICLAEAYSLLAAKDAQPRKKCFTLLDQAERTVRKSKVLEGDGSFARVDIPGLQIIRGDISRRFGDKQEAENALLIVQEHLSPTLTRWRGNLLISEAMLYYSEHDLAGACQLALDALPVVRAICSRSNEAKIEQLYWSFYKIDPSYTDVKTLGEQLCLHSETTPQE